MRVAVYEYITAQGIGQDPCSREHSLYREGWAMRQALEEDLKHAPGVQLIAAPNGAEKDAWLPELVAKSDWQIVIAPEFDGILARIASKIEALGGHLLGPSAAAIERVSDKLQLAEEWRSRGIRCPATSARDLTECEAFPIVWKPRFGAGSTATFLIPDRLEVARSRAIRAVEGHQAEMILQEFVPGQPASLAFLTGPDRRVPLTPVWQHLTADGRFRYEGGELPLPAELAERAITLGNRALEGIDGLRGWVGIDLVLGAARDGSQDCAIEINSRLTTSYIGLRSLAENNLAEALLKGAAGESVSVQWKPGRVRFTAGNAVTIDPV